MTDYSEIKKLAEEVLTIQQTEDRPIGGAWDAFEAAANPAAVLELIAEIERGERMLVAACVSLGGINEALGADMDDDADHLIGMIGDLKAENEALRESNDKLTRRNGMLQENIQALSATHVRYTWLRNKVDQPYNEFVAVTQNIGHDWILVHDLDRALDQMIEEELP